MKFSSLLLLMLSIMMFSSCNTQKQDTDIAGEYVAPTETVNDTQKQPITVSPFATEDFLTPIEEFSWELTEKPEYVVLHFTSAVVLSKTDPYDIENVRSIFEENSLSIHYIIDREGKIHCWLPESRAAWHAGKGTFNNDPGLTDSMNKYSIGIEMLAIGSKSDMEQYLTSDEYDALNKEFIGYTDKQYESLKNLVMDICSRNNIPFDREHVIGHDMYNPAKSDPGELFDYNILFS